MKRFFATLLIFFILIQNTLVVYWDDVMIAGQENWSVSTTPDTKESLQEATIEETTHDNENQSEQEDDSQISLNASWTAQTEESEPNTSQETSLRSSDTESTTWALLDNLFFWTGYEESHWLSWAFGSGILQLAQNTLDTNTGTTQTWQQQAKLFITEYFYHSKNSFIEITNLSDQDYSWSISLTGFAWAIAKKELKYDVRIPAQKSVVFAKSKELLSDTVQKIITKDNYTINQKTWLQISLSDQSWILDTFELHKDRVADIKDAEASFEKVLINGSRLTTMTRPDRKQNISGNFSANPGVYATSAENAKDATKPKRQPSNPSQPQQPQNPQQSWNNQTCFPENSAGLEIQEIFAGNTSLPAYIELKYDFDIPYQKIRFTGDLLNEALTFEWDEFSDFEKNTLFLITKTSFFWDNGIDTIIAPNLEIRNNGWTLILEWFDWTSRQVLDTIYLTSLDNKKAHYYSGRNYNCIRNFDETEPTTPALERRFSFLFNTTSPQIQYIYTSWGWGSYSCPTKADLCWETKDTSLVKSNEVKTQSKNRENTKSSDKKSKSSDFDPLKYEIKIEDIVYDPPWADKNKESITLLLTNWWELDLENIILNIGWKNKKMSGHLVEWVPQTFIGNFWFPNSSKDQKTIPVQLKFWDHIFDTYYYSFEESLQPTKEKSKKAEWYKVFSVLDWDTFRYRDESWKLQSVRLLGVDAPESNTTRYKKTECYWKEAKDYLSQLIKGKQVEIVFDPTQQITDRYGRQVAYVYLDGVLINQDLLEKWYAREYTYKSDYSKQTEFRQAATQAKQQKLWMRNPSICENTYEEYEKLQQTTQNLVIKITNILFDPKGTDKWNEEIELSIYDKSWEIQYIDFSNQFWIYLFEDTTWENQISFDDFSFWTGKFKDIWFLGIQPVQKKLRLKWDFWLPNKKSTCIALVQRDHVFDISCYKVWANDSKENQKEKSEQSVLSWEIKILSLLPNPKGKDASHEFIELLYSGDGTIDLSQNFSLLINWKTKKKLTWSIAPFEPTKIFWSFSLPNTQACISLLHWSETLDTFCYSQHKEWSIIAQNNQILKWLNEKSPEVLKSLQLKRKNNRYCMMYEWEEVKCLNAPKTRIDPLLKAKQQTVEGALKVFEEMLKKDYTALYYQTEIYQIFDLLKKAKIDLKDWKTQTRIWFQNYERKDFPKIYQVLQERTILDTGKEIILQMISPKLVDVYQKSYKNRINMAQ